MTLTVLPERPERIPASIPNLLKQNPHFQRDPIINVVRYPKIEKKEVLEEKLVKS